MAIGVRRLSQPIDMKKSMEASGLFDRVEQPTANNWPIDCYDENNNLIVKFAWSSYHRIYFYYNNGGSDTSSSTAYSTFDVAYYTPRGIMLKCTKSSASSSVIITKDNNGVITFIYTPSTADEYVAIRRSYSGTLTSQVYTPISISQTALVPFVTLINDGDGRSYTPDAFWIPMSENYNIGWCAIAINGAQYVTNGHWALKDTEIV